MYSVQNPALKNFHRQWKRQYIDERFTLLVKTLNNPTTLKNYSIAYYY